jgi:FkbH-like protein
MAIESAKETNPPTELLKQLRAPDLLAHPAEVMRLATRLRRNPVPSGVGRDCRISILSSFTLDYVVDALRLLLLRRNVNARITACGYGQLIQDVLSKGPAVSADPDLVILLPSYRDLRFVPSVGATREEASRAVQAEAAFWCDLVAKVAAPTILMSFGQPPFRILGEADGFLPGGIGRHIREVNLALADQLGPTASLVDAEALERRLGHLAYDDRLYTMCKQPFAMDGVPEVADTLAAAAVGMLGLSRKVLVLDLDNTLWGGVVGDVGAEGLTLGPETAEGEAFVSFQRYVQQLARRGVILAVCSKNHEHIARAAFRDHPAMVIAEADIACFVANFEDKASNIKAIQRTLNVGLDSMVFVDDNPVERAWVAQQLPEVYVVDLPEDPARYASAVEAAKMFPMYRVTQEDLARTRSYRAIAELQQGTQNASDIDGFLKDLSPIASVERVDAGSIDRIVQLIGKTNQFKLNPTLFSHDEIRDNAAGVIAVRLVDRLQDYGIVAVAVTETSDDALLVRNWVMSCRVFSRRLEHVMRALFEDLARRSGAHRIELRFVPSPKNSLVPAVLSDLGFADEGGGNFSGIAAELPQILPHHMEIRDLRAAAPHQEPVDQFVKESV